MSGFRLLGSRWLLWLAATGACAGLVLAACWYLWLRDSTTPVALPEAIASFRTLSVQQRGSVEGVPEPGVYVYATDGFERVDAFLGSRHDYPSRTTMTVSPGDCGLVLRWDALDVRSTTWYLCPGGDRWLLRESDELHRFFGRTERTNYVCEPNTVWWPVADEPGTRWTQSCTSDQSVKTAKASVAGRERVTVGGQAVDAVHLRFETTLRGNTRGQGTFEVWLEPATGLVLRLESADDDVSRTTIGDVRYEERFSLRLTSRQPRR